MSFCLHKTAIIEPTGGVVVMSLSNATMAKVPCHKAFQPPQRTPLRHTEIYFVGPAALLPCASRHVKSVPLLVKLDFFSFGVWEFYMMPPAIDSQLARGTNSDACQGNVVITATRTGKHC